ncbi:hypothetical protein AQI88_06270 [Streptomyces cellostaticus]|uniref:Uncharacterized protein n=1 Tax=Streptomyces cellostaticus TaxID=67285 RepID=A0A124HDH0_9ACTN|nr:hypothetical protein [Streptomyces cellostaticus]KUM97537.1 hypothetical protein AQI88_06270 [Streptomyces cellostaticus]GHI08205.1 hypothetical protein Scel_65260 [Streptomyces cellostaticus]
MLWRISLSWSDRHDLSVHPFQGLALPVRREAAVETLEDPIHPVQHAMDLVNGGEHVVRDPHLRLGVARTVLAPRVIQS